MIFAYRQHICTYKDMHNKAVLVHSCLQIGPSVFSVFSCLLENVTRAPVMNRSLKFKFGISFNSATLYLHKKM